MNQQWSAAQLEKYIQGLKVAWVNDTAMIILLVAMGHWAISFLSPTLATFTASVILGWTLVGGNVFTVVHSLAHQGQADGHLSRLIQAANFRHLGHHAMETDARLVWMAPALIVVTVALNALAIIGITGGAWIAGWDYVTIMLGLSMGAAHWHHAEEDGHHQYHQGIETSFVKEVSSEIHRRHHDDGLPVTALYPYQFGGWYLVPEGGVYLLAATIAIPEGLLARLWPAFDRWLDKQVARHRGEYNAATAHQVTDADAEPDPEATGLMG